MRLKILSDAILIVCALIVQPAVAADATEASPGETQAASPETAQAESVRAGGRVQQVIEDALRLVGIRYRRGGSSTETGFDCSGFVGYVFRERLGLALPRTSREISHTGEPVDKNELEPGDLVFFNTMRHAFSHVGIYLGDNQFVHAPRSGRAVRVEDLRDRYWAKRYNGARRIDGR
jgi:cell wall-associated NlpC family hydrolase